MCTGYISPFSLGLPPAGFPKKKTQRHQEHNTSGPSRFQAYDLSTERYARQCILIVLLELGLFGLQVLQGANLLWDGKTATFGSSLYSVMEEQKTSGCAARRTECLHLLKHFFKGGKVKGPFRKTSDQETNSPPSMPFHSHFHHASTKQH